MGIRALARCASTIALLAAAAVPQMAAAQANPTVLATPVECDRACLSGVLNQVLAGMASGDLSKLPLANHVRATQNGVELSLQDGIWKTVSGLGKYRLDVIDPEGGQAGTFATVLQNNKPVYIALRIRVHEQKIDEIEVISARGVGPGGGQTTAGDRMEAAGTPRPQFLRTVPTSERMSRADLIRISDAYFAHLQASTGADSAPFAKSCQRIENGSQTTNLPKARPGREAFDVLMLDCEQQQRSGFYAFVTSIRDRRFPIVDRERGIVMGFGFFDHTGTVEQLKLTNGMTVPAVLRTPTTFLIAEVFQIERGKIDQIEAVIDTVPYKMRNEIWDRRD